MRMLPREQAKDAINKELPITNFLTKARNGGYVCPYCGSGTGPKGTGAVKVYKETNTAACHACPDPGQKARKFDVMDAIQKAENCDYNTALQIGADLLGITIIRSDNERIESGWKAHKANRSSAREDFKEKSQMTNAELFECLEKIDARETDLISIYTAPAKEPVNGRASYVCPFCGNGKDGPGMYFERGSILKCPSCKWDGSPFELVHELMGKSIYETAEECMKALETGKPSFPIGQSSPAEEKSKAAPVDFTEYYRQCAARVEDPAAVAYIKECRGISIETAKEYWIGYDPQADPANAPGAMGDEPRQYPTPRIIIPVTPGHYIGRRIDAGGKLKKLNNAGAKPGIFNVKRGLTPVEGKARPVFVQEGVFDALSVIEAGREAVALNSTSNTGLFLDAVDEYGAKGPFILAMDGDKAGQKAQKVLADGLSARGLRFIEANINGAYKDANEALIGNRQQFLNDVEAAVIMAEKAAERDDLDEFFEKIQTEAYRPYVTGLSFFDDLLGGGVLMQTVTLIMAAPGAGKTTLCQQIAEEMAMRKKPVVFLNLEMSKEQMIAKAISSRAALEHNSAMTATDILQGYRWLPEAREIVTKTISEYREKIFPYMKYNPADLDSDLDHILSYLDAIGQRARDKGEDGPAVVLDYLHLITTENEKLDDKGLIKKTMKGIKDYCIKYNSFAFIISATNRVANKSGQIGQSDGRDSSNIEYGCDAQISLNFWEVDQGEVSPNRADEMGRLLDQDNRRMILRVLKSRFSRPGRYARVWFNSATSRFYGEYDFIPASISGDLIPFDEISSKDTEATGKDKAKKRL